ncbi:MAG: hypothetical protein EBR67_09810 [Proteobacteria bacterium]|nr:hypothetical protein [Pseudomonadota bacterium]
MAYLKTFRDYSEHDVVNLFAYHGNATYGSNGERTAYLENVALDRKTEILEAGSVVELDPTSPLVLNANHPADRLVSYSPANGVVSDRYGVKAAVRKADGAGSALGITLATVRNFDENGENLAFNPRKAAEMGVVLMGQVVPVLTRGVAAIEVLDNSTGEDGTPLVVKAGWDVYVANGRLQASSAGAMKAGVFLTPIKKNAPTDVAGVALIKFSF